MTLDLLDCCRIVAEIRDCARSTERLTGPMHKSLDHIQRQADTAWEALDELYLNEDECLVCRDSVLIDHPATAYAAWLQSKADATDDADVRTYLQRQLGSVRKVRDLYPGVVEFLTPPPM